MTATTTTTTTTAVTNNLNVRPAMMHANMRITGVFITGEDDFGPLTLSVGAGGIGSMTNFLAPQSAPVSLPTHVVTDGQGRVVEKPVAIEPPKTIRQKNNTTPTVGHTATDRDPEVTRLLSEMKALGLPTKGKHFCKAETLRMLVSEHKNKTAGVAPAPPKTVAPVVNTPPKAVAPVVNTPPKTVATQNTNPPAKNGGFRKSEKNEWAIWKPLCECLAVGKFICTTAAGEVKVKDVAIVDEDSQRGMVLLAWVTDKLHPLRDSEGNPTGETDRFAYHKDGRFWSLTDNEKLTIS